VSIFVNSAFFTLHFALNNGLLEMDLGLDAREQPCTNRVILIFFVAGAVNSWPTAPASF
jgi:hypothetical protein